MEERFRRHPDGSRTHDWQGRFTAQEESEGTLIAQTTFAGYPDKVIWHPRISDLEKCERPNMQTAQVIGASGTSRMRF